MSKLRASTLRCAFSIARVTQRVLDRLAFRHLELVHDRRDPVRGEDAQQRVFQRQEETARARIALAAGTPAQLVIHAA